MCHSCDVNCGQRVRSGRHATVTRMPWCAQKRVINSRIACPAANLCLKVAPVPCCQRGGAIESHLLQKVAISIHSILLKDCDLDLSLDNHHITTIKKHSMVHYFLFVFFVHENYRKLCFFVGNDLSSTFLLLTYW